MKIEDNLSTNALIVPVLDFSKIVIISRANLLYIDLNKNSIVCR